MHTNLAHRSFEPELLDGSDYSDGEYVQCMRQLRLINVLTSGYRPTLGALAHFARLRPNQTLSVLDAGFGYGDTLRAVARWAARRGIKVELTGVDLNGRSADIAREATPESMSIRFLAGNILAYKPARPFDVVINSLFMHHMDDAQTVAVLRWMASNSTLGFAINDLHRHRVAYEFIRVFTRVFGFNRMIRNDAPLSVARAFRASEWRGYAAGAGLDVSRLSVKWYWPFRYGVRYEHAR
jgi:SAM-dependent methyltransferase